MAITSTTPSRGLGAFFKRAVAIAALGACGIAQAGLLTFEQPVDQPFVFSGDHIQFGNYWLESYSGVAGADFTGALINGADTDTCVGISCPVNNKSTYFAAFDDSYIFVGTNNGANFKLTNLKAAFVGAGQASFPAVSGILVLQGYNALGFAVGSAVQVALAGPTGGAFNFNSLSTGTFGNTYVNEVRILGYACDAVGNCTRSTNLSNFAIDDIEMVPEPASIALFGLGLVGLGAVARRRRA